MFKTIDGISGSITILPDGKISFAIFNDNNLELGVQYKDDAESYTNDFKAMGLVFDMAIKDKMAEMLRFLAVELERDR